MRGQAQPQSRRIIVQLPEPAVRRTQLRTVRGSARNRRTRDFFSTTECSSFIPEDAVAEAAFTRHNSGALVPRALMTR